MAENFDSNVYCEFPEAVAKAGKDILICLFNSAGDCRTAEPDDQPQCGHCGHHVQGHQRRLEIPDGRHERVVG